MSQSAFVKEQRDAAMWRSLTKRQREWVMEMLTADQHAVEVRESLACAFAFDLGQRGEEQRRLLVLA